MMQLKVYLVSENIIEYNLKVNVKLVSSLDRFIVVLVIKFLFINQTYYRTLFGRCYFCGACHARMLISGIHLIKIKEIPAKNMLEWQLVR
jgi:hypothetical protein